MFRCINFAFIGFIIIIIIIIIIIMIIIIIIIIIINLFSVDLRIIYLLLDTYSFL